MTRARLDQHRQLQAELNKAREACDQILARAYPQVKPGGGRSSGGRNDKVAALGMELAEVSDVMGVARLEREVRRSRPEIQAYISSVHKAEFRQVLTLRVLFGLEWPEIADTCGPGVGVDAVKKRYERAVAFLPE